MRPVGPGADGAREWLINDLGWQSATEALARRGEVTAVWGEPQPGQLGIGHGPVAQWWSDGRLRTLALPSPARPELHADWARRLTGDDPATAFDEDALAAKYVRREFEIYDQVEGQGATEKFREQVLGADQHGERVIFTNRFLNRLRFLRFLQAKGWLRYGASEHYVEALYDDWAADPGPYLFCQRLALVFFSAMNQPSPAARALLGPRIGDVPYIGSGLFTPEAFEQEYLTSPKAGIITDELFSALLAPGGLMRSYDWALVVPSTTGPRPVAITPTAINLAFDRHTIGQHAPDSRALADRARLQIAEALGAASLEPVRSEWSVALAQARIVDPECGSGSYLVAVLNELVGVWARAHAASGLAADPASLAHQALEGGLVGLEPSEPRVHYARFRLATAALAWEDKAPPRPLPDLRSVVRMGRANVAPATPDALEPREGPRVEFKAGFEWNPRTGQADGNLRTGTLRTIVAFLNTEGGTLWIGIDDHGRAIGIEDDLALIADSKPLDQFELRLREFIKNSIEPIPLGSVRISFPTWNGKVVCRIDVDRRPGVTYLVTKSNSGRLMEEVFVRDGNRTINLSGRARDLFVLERRVAGAEYGE
jgi:hypothetical protein